MKTILSIIILTFSLSASAFIFKFKGTDENRAQACQMAKDNFCSWGEKTGYEHEVTSWSRDCSCSRDDNDDYVCGVEVTWIYNNSPSNPGFTCPF
jgi:hypothetical protein